MAFILEVNTWYNSLNEENNKHVNLYSSGDSFYKYLSSCSFKTKVGVNLTSSSLSAKGYHVIDVLNRTIFKE